MKHKLFDFIKFFWSIFATPIFIYSVLLAFAILVGILTASSFSATIKINMLSDKAFFAFISLKSSFWGLLIGYILVYTFSFLFAVFFYKTFAVIIQVILLVCFGYLFGFDIIIVCSTFSMLSIIFYLVFYVLCKLSIMLIITIVFAVNAKKCREHKKFGYFCFNNFYGLNLKQVYIMFYVLLVIIIIVLCLLCGVFNFTQIA